MSTINLGSILGPEFADLDIEDGLSEETSDSPAGRLYFIEQSHLLYNQGRHILLDRQVLPFADLNAQRCRDGLDYVRWHVLLQDGFPVLEDQSRHAGRALLTNDSYRSVSRPESPLGYLGSAQRTARGPLWDSALAFLRFSDLNWPAQPPTSQEVQAILPEFYIRVTARDFDEPMDVVIERQPVLQMVDVSTGQLDWFKRVADGPLCFPLRYNLSELTRLAWLRYMTNAFALYPIYIGMRAVCPQPQTPRLSNIDGLQKPVALDNFLTLPANRIASYTHAYASETRNEKEMQELALNAYSQGRLERRFGPYLASEK